MLRIGHIDKVEPLRRRGWTGKGSVPRRKDLAYPSDRSTSTADQSKTAHKIPHHVLQERIRSNLETQQFAIAVKVTVQNLAYCMACLTTRGPETREVLLADQDPCSFCHCVLVQRFRKGSHTVTQKCLHGLTVREDVEIGPSRSAEARMEAIVNNLRPSHRKALRRQRVGTPGPGSRVTLGWTVEVNDLRYCMHARVCPTRAH